MRSYYCPVDVAGVLELLFLSMVVGGAAILYDPWAWMGCWGSSHLNGMARLVLVEDSYRYLKE